MEFWAVDQAAAEHAKIVNVQGHSKDGSASPLEVLAGVLVGQMMRKH